MANLYHRLKGICQRHLLFLLLAHSQRLALSRRRMVAESGAHSIEQGPLYGVSVLRSHMDS
jgi:hypothetical protein